MSRSINDPLVVEILAAFDRTMSSPTRDSGFLSLTLNRLIETGDGMFGEEWSDIGARAVLLAWATSAPADTFDLMVDQARELQHWIVGWEVAHAYEAFVDKEGVFDGVDYACLGSVMADVARRQAPVVTEAAAV